ncbi:MAG: NAD-dependent epimerase/dehydratase family protein [Candidatus Bathyarchaeia archaeon]
MKALITGGAGFIGHNAAIHLKNSGFDVAVFDNLDRPSSLALERLAAHNIPIVKGDILSVKAISRALKNTDVVVHAAAYISVEESVKKPALYFKNNVIGTLNVAKACLDWNIKLLVYISSAAVYGEPTQIPISETHPVKPSSPYGLTKLMGEEIVKFYSVSGLKYAILRLFNVYGHGQSSTYAGVITKFIDRVSKGLPPIIYGDGEQTRDFIHVKDVSEAIKLTIEKNAVNETFNIGSGEPTKINYLANLVIKLANLSCKPIYASPRLGDIKNSVADISKARNLLGFKPKESLEEELEILIKNKQEKV